MTKEFNLSEKMFRSQFLKAHLENVVGLKTKNREDFFFVEDVKEFIKKLKEDLWCNSSRKRIIKITAACIENVINERAGKELIDNSLKEKVDKALDGAFGIKDASDDVCEESKICKQCGNPVEDDKYNYCNHCMNLIQGNEDASDNPRTKLVCACGKCHASNDVCKCGHLKGAHELHKSGECDEVGCSCRKFKPKEDVCECGHDRIVHAKEKIKNTALKRNECFEPFCECKKFKPKRK